MNANDSHTIAALSTAVGKAGIAVVRISGDDCFSVIEKVFFPRSGKAITEYPTAHAIYGNIFYNGEVIDDGLCTVFHAPHSYTGENTAEISCHGSELGVLLLLSALYAAGAKPAGAGEFTKRAFLNGKLSLSQAEAVGELLEAESTAALRLSHAKTAGALSEKLSDLQERITDILASVYAVIDYPDEDLSELSPNEMKESLDDIFGELTALCDSYSGGRAIVSGIPTVIVGLPNSGKSSLLNLLTRSERAIVTDIAGTTRDVITEKAQIGNVLLRLSDTAGLRKTDNAVEQIGVERAKKALDDAELILAVLDGSEEMSDEERQFVRLILNRREQRVIWILNKSDRSINEEKKAELSETVGDTPLCFSAKCGDGKDLLRERLETYYPAGDKAIREGSIVTSARMYAALCGAKEHVSDALCTLRDFTPDLAGTDLEQALQALSEADGRSVSAEIVDRIFAKFCVGK